MNPKIQFLKNMISRKGSEIKPYHHIDEYSKCSHNFSNDFNIKFSQKAASIMHEDKN